MGGLILPRTRFLATGSGVSHLQLREHEGEPARVRDPTGCTAGVSVSNRTVFQPGTRLKRRRTGALRPARRWSRLDWIRRMTGRAPAAA